MIASFPDHFQFVPFQYDIRLTWVVHVLWVLFYILGEEISSFVFSHFVLHLQVS